MFLFFSFRSDGFYGAPMAARKMEGMSQLIRLFLKGLVVLKHVLLLVCFTCRGGSFRVLAETMLLL